MHLKTPALRIVFAGTPEFSVGILNTLINTKHQIVGVYCQPDRPQGRGQILTTCPVKTQALKHQLNVYQPDSLNCKQVQQQLSELKADLMIVVAYGQLLSQTVLNIPKYGCLNIHASLLPRWRGAAPIQRAIEAGDKQTGITIIQMDKGLDTGDILFKITCAIDDKDTAQTLHKTLATLGVKAIIETLNNLHNLTKTAQNTKNIVYANKLNKQEAWIEWQQNAEKINQKIRALNPYPIAQTTALNAKLKSQVLRIFTATVLNQDHNKKPGEIIECTKGVCHVATGNGVLSLESVQLPSKKTSNIKAFTNAHTLVKLT